MVEFLLVDVLEPQDDEVGHVGELAQGHRQVVLIHLVKVDRIRTYIA